MLASAVVGALSSAETASLMAVVVVGVPQRRRVAAEDSAEAPALADEGLLDSERR